MALHVKRPTRPTLVQAVMVGVTQAWTPVESTARTMQCPMDVHQKMGIIADIFSGQQQCTGATWLNHALK